MTDNLTKIWQRKNDEISLCSSIVYRSSILQVMSQPSRILPQSKETLLKSYTKRLKDDVKSILDNFTEIVKSSKVSLRVNAYYRGSLFTLFASLAYTIQFLMELQINQF